MDYGAIQVEFLGHIVWVANQIINGITLNSKFFAELPPAQLGTKVKSLGHDGLDLCVRLGHPVHPGKDWGSKLIIGACKNEDINFPNRISTADYTREG